MCSTALKPLTILAFASLLVGCRATGNDRTSLGGSTLHNGVTLSVIHGAGERDEAGRTDDQASLQGLSRTAWARQTVVIPVEGTNAYRRYSRNYQITETTSRQRGDFPTPMSALELSGKTGDEQFVEALASGPYALYEGLVLVPRMFFVRPCEEVRATPSEHWRAPISTPRFTSEQRTPTNQQPATEDPAAAPH